LCWDVTVSCPLAESYVSEAAREAGAAAELAATRKEVKYVGIVGRYMFEPIAIETLGVFNASAIWLLNDLGRRISSCQDHFLVTPERLVISASFGAGAAL